MRQRSNYWLAVAGLLGVGAVLCFLIGEPWAGAVAGGLAVVMVVTPTPEWFDGLDEESSGRPGGDAREVGGR